MSYLGVTDAFKLLVSHRETTLKFQQHCNLFLLWGHTAIRHANCRSGKSRSVFDVNGLTLVVTNANRVIPVKFAQNAVRGLRDV